jgi:hypothetical protein
MQLYSSGMASPIKRKNYTSLVSFSIVSKLHQIICTCVSPRYFLSASSQYRCEVWGKISMSMDSVGLCGIPIAVWQTAVFAQDPQALSPGAHSLVHNTAPWKDWILKACMKYSNTVWYRFSYQMLIMFFWVFASCSVVFVLMFQRNMLPHRQDDWIWIRWMQGWSLK